MRGTKIHEELIELIKGDEEFYAEDNKKTMQIVKESDATFGGVPVPTLYNPYYVTDEDYDDFKYITGTMLNIIDKVTKEYIENREYRRRFMYPEFLEELILVDNGYDMNVPIGRFDFFYDDRENFTFIELNTDGASCMNEDNTIGKIMLDTAADKKLAEKYDLDYFELFKSWVKTTIDIYNEFDGENKVEKPNVAIVDFTESATMTDFMKFKEAYESLGYNCEIVDPRDVVYRDGKMYVEDYRIDLVYRRIVTFELVNNVDEVSQFIEAYKNKAFCCIGSLKSQIGHNKIFFKILHDKETMDLLTVDEKEYVRRHIPFTALFSGDRAVFDDVLKNKDKYIMKPMDMNASQGVFVGRDKTQHEWEEKLKEVWDKDYIYQEFVDPYGREFATFEGDKLVPKEFGVVTGVFLYGEEIAGVYSRIGNENIISNVADYYSIPGIRVKSK